MLPLARYVRHEMRMVDERDGFEIRVHPLRESPWVTPAENPPNLPRGKR
jgi:hypothetical protein